MRIQIIHNLEAIFEIITVKVLVVLSTFVPIIPMYEKKMQAGLESGFTPWVRGEFHVTGQLIYISSIKSECKSLRV